MDKNHFIGEPPAGTVGAGAVGPHRRDTEAKGRRLMRQPIGGAINPVTGTEVTIRPRVEPSEGADLAEWGAKWDEAMTALHAIGIHPDFIAHGGEHNEVGAANLAVYERGREAGAAAEREQIADDMMAWAERNHLAERYGAASALSIASNMVRRKSPRRAW